LPSAQEEGGFLTGLGFAGLHWLWPLTVPILSAITAFWATRAAAFKTLRSLP
jgi:cell division transport system permease protein